MIFINWFLIPLRINTCGWKTCSCECNYGYQWI